ncbi:hypothetical protein [Phnomibacter sp. MR]|uniref:hypothetical protein n=1 Tax=Phnomibacter sp. MR TaxID=3042318 RepID=UPI003A7FFE82
MNLIYQSLNHVFVLLLSIAGFQTATAQDTVKRRTIEITSSFKPGLQQQQKFGFTASATPADSARPKLSYKIPSQNLAFNFVPAPLRPLAFQEDSSLKNAAPSVYVKAGFGNFSTPFLQALASFGNGEKSNGSVEGNYTSSKGNLDYQKAAQYGVKGNLWLHMKQNNSLHLYGGYQGQQTQRYGWEPKATPPVLDSMALQYNTIFVGAGLGNSIAGDAGVSYDAKIDAHFFSDKYDAQETAVRFEAPITKTIGDNASVTVGIKGMLSSFRSNKSDFSNNLFMIPVNAQLQLKDNISVKAGIIPSWNNKVFKLLPDVSVEYLLNEKNLVLQAGVRGYYDEQTFRSLAAFNPWMQQPDSLTNTRNSEIFAAVKSNVNENLGFRVKAGVGKQSNVPLFVNDSKDGSSFQMIRELDLNRVFIAGELVYQQGQKLNWTNSLQVNMYNDIDAAPKAYGLLPFEFRSSVQLLIRKDLRFKADLYTINGAWYRDQTGDDKKGKSVLDLNAGLEFDVHKKVKLWLQLNNIVNQDYQRWNQYRVFGFQALGGAIFHF